MPKQPAKNGCSCPSRSTYCACRKLINACALVMRRVSDTRVDLEAGQADWLPRPQRIRRRLRDLDCRQCVCAVNLGRPLALDAFHEVHDLRSIRLAKTANEMRCLIAVCRLWRE